MAAQIEDPFVTLERYDVVLSNHVKLVLKKLGYECLGSISLVNVEEVQEGVREFFCKSSAASKNE